VADAEHLKDLLGIASDRQSLVDAQHTAAARLLAYDGETYPHDGCAITLSVLLQRAGIDVPDSFEALELTNLLRNDRAWARIEVGNQQAGDVGTTCFDVPHHGQDHIYLVLKPLNKDEMIVADNQEPAPHFRYASGAGGKTPTNYFLRAGGS